MTDEEPNTSPLQVCDALLPAIERATLAVVNDEYRNTTIDYLADAKLYVFPMDAEMYCDYEGHLAGAVRAYLRLDKKTKEAAGIWASVTEVDGKHRTLPLEEIIELSKRSDFPA